MSVEFDQWVSQVSQWQDQVAPIPAIVHDRIVKARLKPEEAKHAVQSLMFDPLAVQYAMGYKDRKYSLTYDILKRIPHQLSVVGAILQTRCNQVSAFSVPFRSSKSVGFVIKHKDPGHLTSKSEQEFIKDLETFIYKCGYKDPNPHNETKRDDFETFLKKIVRDSLMYDQACLEIVPDRRGMPYEFVAVDASTIRIAAKNTPLAPDSTYHERHGTYTGARNANFAGGPYRSLKLYQGDKKKDPAFVQVINGQIANVYEDTELAFGIRNPRTDIYIQGYGYGELEQLVTIVTAHLYAEEYNRRFFMQGSAPKGILTFKGDGMTPDQLEGFKRQWKATLEGVENCLFGGTRIYTAESGFRSLEDLCGGRNEVPVRLWTGTSWESGLVYKTQSEKHLCHTTLDNGVVLSSSPDHKFRVIGGSGDPLWKTQEELVVGDVALVNKEDPSLSTELHCLGKEVDLDFAEVLGWFVGDGNVTYKTNDRGYGAGAQLSWFYNPDTELDLRDNHLASLQKYFPDAYAYTRTRSDAQIDSIKNKYGFKSVQRTVECILLHNKKALAWFEAHGFIQGGKKAIPPQLFTTSAEFRGSYLRGLFSADGNNARLRTPELTCSDDNIRSTVRQLLLSLGIRTALSEGTTVRNPSTKEVTSSPHKLSIKDRDTFFTLVGFSQDHKQPSGLSRGREANKGDFVPRSTLTKYLTQVRTANKAAGYTLLSRRERQDLNSILCGSDGCSKSRLLRYLDQVSLETPSWLTSYHTAKVVGTRDTGLYVPMYDVSVDHEDHMFMGDGVLLSNSWKTPILQSEQGVDWTDLHPSNREMEYNAWIEYLLKVTCFTENTPITMADGTTRPISLIRPGDLVTALSGSHKPVSNLQITEYDGDLHHLRAGSVMEVTPEHPLYVASSVKHNGVRKIGEPSWKQAKDVLEGTDFLTIPKKTYAHEGTTTKIDLVDHLTPGSYKLAADGNTIAPKANRVTWVNRYIDLADHAFALGLYLAEGNTTDYATYFTFAAHEQSYVDSVCAFADAVGAHAKPYKAKHSTANVRVHSSILAKALSSLLGSTAHYKMVPKEIFDAPKSIQKSFISGVIAGDGSVFKSGNVSATVSLVSDRAIEGLRHLLLNQDVYAHKYEVLASGLGRGGAGAKVSRVDMYGPQLRKLSSWLQGPKGDKLRTLVPYITDKSKVYESNSYFFVPVSEHWVSNYRGKVYNIEVAEEHTYQAHRFAVHNCAVYLIDPAELNFDLHGGVQQTPLFESSQEWKLKASRDRGLKPLLRFIAKLINEHVISKIDDHFVFDFVGLDELTEQEKHTLRTEQVSSYLTLNEVRREDDLADLEYGDIPMNPVYLQAMQIKQQMEQQEQQMAAQDPAQAQQGPAAEGSGAEQPSEENVPEYTDSFGKSVSLTQGSKYLEIDLSDLDSWKDSLV